MNQQLGLFLPLILLFVLMYFMMIRPQKKREKQVQAMRGNLKKGDKVVTIGGICGKITRLDDEKITLEVSATSTEKVRIEFMKWAVQRVEEKEDKSKQATPVDEETESSNKKPVRKSLAKKEEEKSQSSPELE